METMASSNGPEAHPLDYAGINGDLDFEFFQLIRRLEEMNPGYSMLGEESDPAKELMRLEGSFDLGFPCGDIKLITKGGEGENPVKIALNFLALGGPHGPLPIPYSRLVLDRYNQRDRALSSFLNNFNHRLYSLFYRAVKLFKPMVSGDTVEKERYAKCCLAVLGFDSEQMRGRMSVPDRAVIAFSSIFLSGSRSAAGLEVFLSRYFGTKVFVSCFDGGWESIPERKHSRLGISGVNNILGSDMTLGTRAWVDQHMITIHINNLSWETYREFLPGEVACRSLRDLIRIYAGDEFDFRVCLDLLPEEIPGCCLGDAGRKKAKRKYPLESSPRLGWSSIMRSSSEPPENRPALTLNLV